jgi:hypothetical protein
VLCVLTGLVASYDTMRKQSRCADQVWQLRLEAGGRTTVPTAGLPRQMKSAPYNSASGVASTALRYCEDEFCWGKNFVPHLLLLTTDAVMSSR